MNALQNLANICPVPQKGTPKVQLSVRITPLEMAALKRRADSMGLTITEAIRSILRELETYERNPPQPAETTAPAPKPSRKRG